MGCLAVVLVLIGFGILIAFLVETALAEREGSDDVTCDLCGESDCIGATTKRKRQK